MAIAVLEVSDAEFEEKVLKADKPALVDFWAPWCGPCRMLGPTIEALAKDYAGKAIIAKVNVEDNQEMVAKYGIMSIPAVLLFKSGQVVGTLVVAQNRSAYVSMLDKHLEG
jgi:thioredoxin 1